MGKKEFANQQPTQNLAGRGRRGIQNTVHTKGETKSRVSIEPVLPLLAIPWSWSWDLHGSLSPLPPLPFSFKLTKKHGIPKSQHSAGQVPLAANVQPNKKKKNKINTRTQKKAPSKCRAVIHMEIPEDESRAEPDRWRILSQVSSVNISVSRNPSQSVSCGK